MKKIRCKLSALYPDPPSLSTEDFPALLAQRLRMGVRHAPGQGQGAAASPVRLDRGRLEEWEDLARRHDEGIGIIAIIMLILISIVLMCNMVIG